MGAVAFVCRCVHIEGFNVCQLHTSEHMAKTSAISVRVSDDVKAAAEKAAKDDSRSLAALTEKILSDWLRKNGYLEPNK